MRDVRDGVIEEEPETTYDRADVMFIFTYTKVWVCSTDCTNQKLASNFKMGSSFVHGEVIVPLAS